MKYWLLKSEPETFSIDKLKQLPKQIEHWDGVRNYQARNLLRDEVKVGDLAFFYHSSCKIPGIVGIVEVVKSGYPDFTAFDPHSNYYDPQSVSDNPRWYMIDVKYQRHLKHIITLQELRGIPFLENLRLLQKGNRLSVMPVTKQEWQIILELE